MIQTIASPPSVEGLASPRLLTLGNVALFLDLDGTLAPIEASPGKVGPDPERTALLGRLQLWLGGALAVLSGRSVDEVDRILGGVVACVSGGHGRERRSPTGERVDFLPDPSLPTVAAMLESFVAAQRGLLLERKAGSLALHYRGHPPAAEACLDIAHRLARAHNLDIIEGRMVVELLTPGPNKGDALGIFMQEAAFAGRRPVMVGDDLTDESAFEAAAALGGFGVLVGEPRETAARNRLANPQAVLTWLAGSMQ